MNKLQNGINKINSFLPVYGFWGTLNQIARNVFLVELTCRFEKILAIPEEKVVPKIPLEVIPLIGEFDLDTWGIIDALLQIRGQFGVEQAEERLENGYVMFCAVSEGKFVGFIWLNAFPVDGAGYKLNDDEAYHIDGWVFAPYRGNGVLPALQQGVFNYLRANYPQIRILIGHASAWNKSSIIGQQRAGLVMVAKELSIVFFSLHRKFHLYKISKN